MARSRDPFNQALSALRAAIEGGRLRGGGPVIVATEAEALKLSITPVREALARLEGEGLVERAPGGGYLVVRLEASDAAGGYRLLQHQLRLADLLTRDALGRERPACPLAPDPRDAASVLPLFDRIILGAGNAMLAASHLHARRRLAPLARAETALFDNLEHEARDLYAAASLSAEAFDQGANLYFERRVRAAPMLVRLTEELAREDPAA